MENFKKLENNQLIEKKVEDKTDYKKKFYSLLRELSSTHTTMCKRCPLVKSCCGGCSLLKSKINRIKKEVNFDENR